MFQKLLGKCIHYYSLHGIYFLVMHSIEPEARIPLWHPKRMCWRQWINYLLQFKSHKAPWTAPATPTLSADRDLVPTYGSWHTALNPCHYIKPVPAAQWQTDSPASGGCWGGPDSWLAWKGDTFLCVPACLLLTVMFEPRIMRFLSISWLWKQKRLF